MKILNKFSKFASLLLALMLVLTMAAPAMADTTKYTITVNNATSGYTYEAYQIFKGDLSSDNSILSNIEWGSGIDSSKTSALISALQALTVGENKPFESCTTAAQVAEVLSGGTKDNAVAQAFADTVSQYLSTMKTSFTYSEGKYTASVEAGYYLIKNSSVADNGSYTRFILEVVKNVIVSHKGSVPTVEKKIVENSEKKVVGDYNIGDTVTYELTGTLPENYGDYETYKYVFHDKLSDGLTFNSGSVTVKVGETTIDSSNYSVVTEGLNDGCTFEVQFANLKTISGLTKDSKITVSYTATVNSNAVIGSTGNPNTVTLEFSNNPNKGGEGDTNKTPEDKVVVFTFELDVTKVDGDNSEKKLEGAQFVLLNSDKNKVATVVDGKLTGWGDVLGEDESWPENSVLTSDKDGLFKIQGLDAGTYYLKEIKAPDGYNLLANDIKVVIEATYDENGEKTLKTLTIKVDDGEAANGTIQTGIVEATVENKSGATLPSTGGMGTTLFYVVGGLLVAGAVIVMISKKHAATK